MNNEINRYRTFGIRTSGDNRRLCISCDVSESQQLYPSLIGELLLQCRESGTLEEHALNICRFQKDRLLRQTATQKSRSPLRKLIGLISRKLLDQNIELPISSRELSKVKQQLQIFIHDGLLVSSDDILNQVLVRANEDTPDVHSPVHSIGLPTCNRSRLLDRALKSYGANIKHFSRSVRFLIVDDSRDPSVRTSNSEVAAQHAATTAWK